MSIKRQKAKFYHKENQGDLIGNVSDQIRDGPEVISADINNNDDNDELIERYDQVCMESKEDH